MRYTKSKYKFVFGYKFLFYECYVICTIIYNELSDVEYVNTNLAFQMTNSTGYGNLTRTRTLL